MSYSLWQAAAREVKQLHPELCPASEDFRALVKATHAAMLLERDKHICGPVQGRAPSFSTFAKSRNKRRRFYANSNRRQVTR